MLNRDFFAQLDQNNFFDLDVDIQVKRIAAGEAYNDYLLIINDVIVLSNQVVTTTEEPATPTYTPTAETPTQAQAVLPSTGETGMTWGVGLLGFAAVVVGLYLSFKN
ncbi:hypothetical protein [Streptococcus dentiloxodontae]